MNDGRGLSGDKKGLQNPLQRFDSASGLQLELDKVRKQKAEAEKENHNLRARITYLERAGGYKDEYIKLKKALTELKRGGKPSEAAMEALGWESPEFSEVSEYLVAYAFDRKERAEFVKRLQKLGVDLYQADALKGNLDIARARLEKDPENTFLQAAEMILGNFLYGGGITWD